MSLVDGEFRLRLDDDDDAAAAEFRDRSSPPTEAAGRATIEQEQPRQRCGCHDRGVETRKVLLRTTTVCSTTSIISIILHVTAHDANPGGFR